MMLVVTPRVMRQENELLQSCWTKHVGSRCSHVFGPDTDAKNGPKDGSKGKKPKNRDPDGIQPETKSNSGSKEAKLTNHVCAGPGAGKARRHAEVRNRSAEKVAGDEQHEFPRLNRNRPLSKHRNVENSPIVVLVNKFRIIGRAYRSMMLEMKGAISTQIRHQRPFAENACQQIVEHTIATDKPVRPIMGKDTERVLSRGNDNKEGDQRNNAENEMGTFKQAPMCRAETEHDNNPIKQGA